MIQIPSGIPRLMRARGEYRCEARQCIEDRPILSGEVYVGAHDYSPQRSADGRPLSHLKHNHFTVRYHIVCFEHGYRTDQGGVVRRELQDLDGFARYQAEVEDALVSFRERTPR
jgi:hypothetical protein